MQVASFQNKRETKFKTKMISLLEVVVIVLQLFLPPMPMAFSSLMSSGFHKLSVPRNGLCSTRAFKSISKIECASNCLLKDTYNSCTAFIFDTTQKQTPCTCMRAKCIPDPTDASPPIALRKALLIMPTKLSPLNIIII